METDAIIECIERLKDMWLPAEGTCALAEDGAAELTALEAKLQNREDILRAFSIAAKRIIRWSAFARQIVAVVEAALSPLDGKALSDEEKAKYKEA